MRIWLGAASNCASFSSHTFHPSLVLAKSLDLATIRLSGPQMQPAQDWLPTSIPHTYLIVTSSSEEDADGVGLITHLFCLLSPSLSISSGAAEHRLSERETRPARVSASSSRIGNLVSGIPAGNSCPLHQAP